MRARTPDPELLEPLPVEVDGVTVAPEPASRDFSTRDAMSVMSVMPGMPTRHEVVEAIRATIAEASTLRDQSPWRGPIDVRPPPPTILCTAGFSRMLNLAPARLDALGAWWAAHQRDGGVEIGGRLFVGPPHRRAADTWCLRGRLRRPWRARAITVDVVMWPHLGMWTKLSLEPQRSVRVGRRYFRSGHRVLDMLTDRVIREL
jgi:hypothetical protein